MSSNLALADDTSTVTEPFKVPSFPDLNKFSDTGPELEARYGLPREIQFCKRCLISNQRPNTVSEFLHHPKSKKTTIKMDQSGICDACRHADSKRKIDWVERKRELSDLCARYRRNDGKYDCIVPGSGGKDSFYAAHLLRYEFGMHPLTVTWSPHIHTEWGWRNFQRWIHAGFDNVLFTPNGKVHRLLTRLATETLFHPFQPFVLGQKNFAPKMAALHDTPLVFYGEAGAEYGTPRVDTSGNTQDWELFTSSDKSKLYLGGVSISDLLEHFGVETVDLEPFLPSDPEIIRNKKIEVHQLSYYVKWHPQTNYYYAVEHGDFEASPERTPGTYSKYNSIDDRIDDLFYYTYFTKFGFGRATCDATQEIRSGDIEIEEGRALIRRYDGEFPERFAKELFEYLSLPPKEFPEASQMFEQPEMDRDYFMALADSFRSPHIWKHENGSWALRHACWHQL